MCGSKNGYKKETSSRDWTTYSKFVDHSRLKNYCNWRDPSYMIVFIEKVKSSYELEKERLYRHDLNLLIILH
jgi:hypothetical protein